jgi:ribosomal protein S18 acetylase RimI-like enzyme
MTDTYTLHPSAPGVGDYMRLRAAAGMSARSVEGAAIGLPNSWFAVTILHQGHAVGMGRIIGDGGTAFQIVDIVVEPDHQKRGLGKRIMTALMERLISEAPPAAYVSLIADGDAQHLYAKFGFAPTAPESIGMYWRVPQRPQ